MSEISTNLIKEAVYDLCFEANTCLCDEVYSKILKNYETQTDTKLKNILGLILKNAKTAYEKKLPLCQDTGQVVVFLEVGQDVLIKGEFIEEAINSAVSKCYIDNFFRKSVVKNAVFDRANTKNNTPVIIHTKFVKGEELNIKVLIKGAGSENKSRLEMMLPTASEEEIIQKISNHILAADVNACPPMFIGVGIGGTSEKAMILSKEALVYDDFSQREREFAQKIKAEVNKNADNIYKNCYVEDVKVLTSSTHIACLPVAITVNCHSDRVASCTISDNKITYNNKIPNFVEVTNDYFQVKEIQTTDISAIRKLQQGEEALLTGEIYVARDMAHKKMFEMIERGESLPFDIKDKIIFYAGPCPNKDGEIIGSIGPTTASRMDKYAEKFYNIGLLATIGKGSRSKSVADCIKKNNAKYFSTVGGIAALLSETVKEKELIAFEELGAEALYKIKVEKFPIKTEIA